MVEINFKCDNCDFSFLDKNLIFYLDTNLDDLESILNFYSEDKKDEKDGKYEKDESIHLELIEDSHNKENSDKMTKSLISGFLYENYCPDCNELIKTYVPEDNELFTQEEIEKILTKEISKNPNNEKVNFQAPQCRGIHHASRRIACSFRACHCTRPAAD